MKGFWLAIIALQILCSCSLLELDVLRHSRCMGVMVFVPFVTLSAGALGSSTANLQQGCYLAVSNPLPHLPLPFYFHSRLLQSLPDNKYKYYLYYWETGLQKVVYLHLYYGQDQALVLCTAHQWKQTPQVKREKATAFAHEMYYMRKVLLTLLMALFRSVLQRWT